MATKHRRYLPLVDDNGIDGIIRRTDGSFTEFRIKSRSMDVIMGNAPLHLDSNHVC